MAEAGSLMIKVRADMKDFEKSMDGLQKNMKNVGDSMSKVGGSLTKYVTGPIVALGGGMLALATKTGNYADSILDLQAATGHSTRAIQEWQAVADRAGTNTDAVTNASQALTRAMSRGAEGSADMRQAMEMLGLSMDEVRNLSPDDRMNVLMEALSGVEDAGKRAELGNKLLRGSYEDLAPILAMTDEQMQDVIKTAEESGKIMGDDALKEANAFREGMEELKTEFVGLGRTIMGDLMPVIQGQLIPFIKESVIPALRNFGELIGKLISWFTNLSPETQKYIGIAVALAAAIGPVLVVAGKMIALFSTLIPIVKAVGLAVAALTTGPLALIVAGIAGVIAAGVLLYKNWDTIKEWAGKLGESVKSIFTDMLEFVKNLGGAFIDAGKNIVNSITDGIKAVAMGPVNAIKDVAGNIRNMLPFSPAKEGPLKDLDKLDFGGPIEKSIRHDIGSVQGAMGDMLHLPAMAGAGNGQSVNIFVELDGRTIAKAVGQPLVDEIRARTGLRI